MFIRPKRWRVVKQQGVMMIYIRNRAVRRAGKRGSVNFIKRVIFNVKGSGWGEISWS